VVAPSAEFGQGGLRILLAEDNLFNRRVAILTLQREGHSVYAVGDGQEALAALEREVFDLVLMDVQMPTMDGLEATAVIRCREAGCVRRLPVVALTANGEAEDRARCRAAGMDGCLTKPIQPALLRQTLIALGADKDKEKRSQADTEKEAGGAVVPVFDRGRALERVGGDPALLREVTGLFLSDSVRLLGQVEEALRDGSAERLRKAAHTLKGSVAFFAAPAAEAAARRLELEAADFSAAPEAARILTGEVARLRQALTEEERE
jgi:CheY-like chemotaxis protein